MAELPVPLTELDRDLPAPPGGWVVELQRRGIGTIVDDLGRVAVARPIARRLFAEHRENEARKAAHRAEIERQAIEANRQFRASLPSGIPVDQVPAGVSAAVLMMASDDPFRPERRETPLEHALRNGGAPVYHPVGAGGQS
jgi:hypothetical protein